MKRLIYLMAILLMWGCSDTSLNEVQDLERGNGKGKVNNKKGIVFAPSVSQLRTPGNTNLTTPVEYLDGASFDFDSSQAELNGVTYSIEYQVWNGVVTLNTFLVGTDGTNLDVDVEFIKVVNINGVDTVLFADDEGIKDLSGNILYACSNYFDVYYQPISFDVHDIDFDGTDDLIVAQSGSDNHIVTVVHDFLGNATETVASYDTHSSSKILAVTDDSVIFKGGSTCDGVVNYSISTIEEATPPTSYAELLESMIIVLTPPNANQIEFIEFTGLPECERLAFTVKGATGEYIGFGIGNVANGETWVLANYDDDPIEPNQVPLPVGTYIAEFPKVPSTANPNAPVQITFEVL